MKDGGDGDGVQRLWRGVNSAVTARYQSTKSIRTNSAASA